MSALPLLLLRLAPAECKGLRKKRGPKDNRIKKPGRLKGGSVSCPAAASGAMREKKSYLNLGRSHLFGVVRVLFLEPEALRHNAQGKGASVWS